MLKYGIYAKAVELLCFKSALLKLSGIYPEMDMKSYKKSVKREYKAMLLRTPDIGGSFFGNQPVYRGICFFVAQSKSR